MVAKSASVWELGCSRYGGSKFDPSASVWQLQRIYSFRLFIKVLRSCNRQCKNGSMVMSFLHQPLFRGMRFSHIQSMVRDLLQWPLLLHSGFGSRVTGLLH